jgi:hypothetical protein
MAKKECRTSYLKQQMNIYFGCCINSHVTDHCAILASVFLRGLDLNEYNGKKCDNLASGFHPRIVCSFCDPKDFCTDSDSGAAFR